VGPDSAATIAEARELVRGARSIVVLTGAGISTSSGIPDFRGPNGVWTKDPAAQRLFELQPYLDDAEVRRQVWQLRRSAPVFGAHPNAGHLALAEMHHTGRLRAIVTQNIDGLHQLAGSPPERVIEVHGTIRFVECMTCGQKQPSEQVFERLDAGETDPACLSCGGILKTATISFGQNLKRTVLAAAMDAAEHADLFLAVGTSLAVYPAASLPEVAAGRGARLIIVNAEPTPYDGLADAVLRTPISDVLPELLALD